MTKKELLFASSQVEIQAADDKSPQVRIIAYTGGLMNVPGWGWLVINLAGLEPPPGEQVTILADHDSRLQGIVGYGRAHVVGGELIVEGTLTLASEAAQQILELTRSGFRFQASVGVAPVEYRRVTGSLAVNGRIIESPRGGLTFIKRSICREVSIVPIGADAHTSVSIAASAKECNMDETREQNELITADEIRAAALAESERIAAIQEICGGRFAKIEAQAIREGWDAEQTKLAVLRASRPMVSGIGSWREPPLQAVLEAGVLSHMGREDLAEKHLGPEAAQRGHDLKATSLMDLCRAALQLEGRDIPRGRDGMIRAAFSTMSLPVALGDAANKILLEAYNESPATWRSFAAIKSANDFKQHTAIRATQTGELEQVAPGGELKYGSISESTFNFKVDTFGKVIGIDRRDIINDDLSLFEDTARSLGRSAMRAVADLVYSVLLANADGFFSTSHANYDEGADTALSSASLSAGIARMLAQKDDEGRDLDIRPRVLLVPPELQQTAKELLLSDFIQRANNDVPTGNALKNIVTLEVEPRLSNSQRFTGTSENAWYLFGGPQDAPLIVAFLQGKQTPTIEFFDFNSDPNVLAASWRVYFDFGCALADYRAAYKAKGEA